MNRIPGVTLALCVTMSMASLAGQALPPLVVAYMTSDGELVPVARLQGSNWLNTWPEPIQDDAPLPVRKVSEIPRDWLGQPVPLTWTAWSTATGKQHRVTVTGVDRDGSCAEAITLATGVTPNPRSDGLAFNRPTIVNEIVESVEGSPERDREWTLMRRLLSPHFKAAVAAIVPPKPGEPSQTSPTLLALAGADSFASENIVVQTVLRDPRLPFLFIEARRQFAGIPPESSNDAILYRGWFWIDRAGDGALRPVNATTVPFSTAEDPLPRYTPIGIMRVGVDSIWVMSEWGIESQTIVLFEVSAKAVRKLTSAFVSGC